MLNVLRARLQQYVNHELLVFKLDLEKAEEPDRVQIANIRWIIEKAREFQKNIYFCFIDHAESFWLCRSQQNVENFERYEYQSI